MGFAGVSDFEMCGEVGVLSKVAEWFGVVGFWCGVVYFMIVSSLCLLPGALLLSHPVLLFHPLDVGFDDVECEQSGGCVYLFTGGVVCGD